MLDEARDAITYRRKGGRLGVEAASVRLNKHYSKSATSRYSNDQCWLPQPYLLKFYNVTSCLAQAIMTARAGQLSFDYRCPRHLSETDKNMNCGALLLRTLERPEHKECSADVCFFLNVFASQPCYAVASSADIVPR